METKLAILKLFFEEPYTQRSIREVARHTKFSHMTVRKYFAEFEKENYLTKKATKLYPLYHADAGSKAFLNLKLFYNLEKVRKSGIVEKLEHCYEYPIIVLFGSFAKAVDDEKSDIDICIISAAKKDFDTAPFEHILGRKISFHLFDKKNWVESKKKNPGLINSICNGIVLLGQLEVL